MLFGLRAVIEMRHRVKKRERSPAGVAVETIREEQTMQWLRRVSRIAVLAAVLPAAAYADVAFITGGNSIWKWDTSTNTVTSVVDTGFPLDSLIFDKSGNIVSSRIFNNQLGRFNGTTDTTFTSGGLSLPADMALEPGGASLVVGNVGNNTISRVSATTGSVTNTLSMNARPDGLAYDASGHLFAVLGRNTLAQIDPTTGNVLNSIDLLDKNNQPTGSADGLSFDAATGKLYVSFDRFDGGYWVVPTDLSSQRVVSLNVDVDGLAANGNKLYLIARGSGALQVDLATDTISLTSPAIGGADDIAPLAGLGSPVPEPSSIALMLGGVAAVGLRLVRREKEQRS
jgi:sugar lactone lactonase YvrE